MIGIGVGADDSDCVDDVSGAETGLDDEVRGGDGDAARHTGYAVY